MTKVEKSYTLLLFLLIFCFQLWKLPIVSGDTIALFSSAETLKQCFLQVELKRCEGVIQFGYTQHFLAMVIGSKFSEISNQLTAYAIMNLILFWTLIIYLLRMNLNFLTKLFMTSLVLFSPLLAYSIETFSEMSNVFFILLFILLLFKNVKFYLVFIFSILASGYRESSFLLTFSVVVIYFFIFKNKALTLKKCALLLISPFLGLITLLIFNIYKNGSFLNPVYGFERFSVNSPGQFILNFVGLFLSPTGGILGNLWFFSFPLLLLFPILLVQSYKNTYKLVTIWGLLLAINLAFIAFTRVPYGWVAFGPRYAMVIVIGFLFVLFMVWDNKLGSVKHRAADIGSGRKILDYYIFTYFPSIFALIVSLGWMANPWLYAEFDNDSILECPGTVYLEDSNYFECTNTLAWRVKPLPVILLQSLMKFSALNLITILILLISFYLGYRLVVNRTRIILIFEKQLSLNQF